MGVPQGSILGPILFLLYINDLYKVTDLFTLLYADDTSFIISGKSLDDVIIKLNIELKKVCDWFRSNKLSLHPEKTKFMIFNKQESSINWNEIKIQLNFNNMNENKPELITNLGYINSNTESKAIKFLGVYIDPKLDFKFHIKYVQKKIMNSLYMLRKLKNTLSKESLRTLYFSLIDCHINYCLPIWSSGLPSSLKPIYLLQKKAVRIITNSKYNTHSPPLFKKLGILPIHEQTEFSKLSFMHDFINGKLPSSFNDTWKRNSDLNLRIIRDRNKFNVPLVKFTSIERFPFCYFQKLWNEKCDNDLLNSNQRKKIFTKNLKTFLMIGICSDIQCQEC